MSYPGFQDLPRGIRMLLLASESFFFAEAQPSAGPLSRGKTAAQAAGGFKLGYEVSHPLLVFGPAWSN